MTNLASAEPIERGTLPESINYYIPIERIDREKREVIGTATAEVEDGHGTIFRYQGSKDAFTAWRGNIREMHDPHKAVGRALEIKPDDDNKQIIVRAKISNGAEDTWQKVLDGTLTGFSVGGKNGKWSEIDKDGRRVQILDRYDLVELSLVDNPSCPVANIAIVRANGSATDVLAADSEDEISPSAEPVDESIERAGARISADTKSSLHTMRDQAMTLCGCDDCVGMVEKLAAGEDAQQRALIAEIIREVNVAIQAQLGSTTQRVNALLARDAQRKEAPDLTRRVDDLSSQLDEIKTLCKKIAETPLDGGPVLHGAGVAVEKHLATSGVQRSAMSDADVIQRAAELGFAPPTNVDDAIRAAAALVPRR
ncbi:HK97 family phage prohead protease [Tengunoibacter tsumagoiensis]|uniref:Uncharacterized protein n=1 Tax=Tengunoibacter tsumagoiensis TaxID=2014871 RepID=A0A402A513_9CHLR|nr:HK97 family phage prohead protease [Tengunoibacter tsumagoiensis]GCE14192.1 hypothetical protein KTT_40510 [Tengunoibacter tsumagoiensis]GCE14246.1 hypothetical protein KTT_41050 [Tengunoibacter tsumagoiensis]